MAQSFDNTKTVVDAPISVVRSHMKVSLQQLTRAANSAANKHGADHPITKGYRHEENKLTAMIANLKQE